MASSTTEADPKPLPILSANIPLAKGTNMTKAKVKGREIYCFHGISNGSNYLLNHNLIPHKIR